MVIPTEFELFGQIITVEYTSELIHQSDSIGQARYRDNKIKLMQPSVENPIPRERLEKTFIHELMHWIFEMLQIEEELHTEKNIDNIACLLHQFFKTQKFNINGQKVE